YRTIEQQQHAHGSADNQQCTFEQHADFDGEQYHVIQQQQRVHCPINKQQCSLEQHAKLNAECDIFEQHDVHHSCNKQQCPFDHDAVLQWPYYLVPERYYCHCSGPQYDYDDDYIRAHYD
ncbi:hypothetical protein KC352_g45498, partial [Hortaea werneckii]